MTKGSYRTFHWDDGVGITRSVRIDKQLNISFAYTNNYTANMTPEIFDDLIQFVYSEIKRQKQNQKEDINANT